MLIRSMRTLILVLCFTAWCSGKVLIFDLGDVLFKQSHFGIARSVGLFKFGLYSLLDFKTPKIDRLLFSILDGCEPQLAPDADQMICAPKGQVLPQVMCDWLNGLLTPEEFIKKAHLRIDQYENFSSWREENLVRSAVNVLCDPHALIQHTYPISDGVKLLKDCAAYRDEKGNPHTLIVLSNWDPYSFPLLHDRYKNIFDYFNHIVVSGYIGMSKPYYACFQYVLDTFQLSPDDCYFFDDQERNIKAANRCGIHGLQLKNGDYRGLRRQLHAFKVL